MAYDCVFADFQSLESHEIDDGLYNEANSCKEHIDEEVNESCRDFWYGYV